MTAALAAALIVAVGALPFMGMAGTAPAATDTPRDEAPRRVVSINLCTDQLAMLLAAPGQLISVTDFARDPRQSVLAEAAADIPVNHARAEEVYLLHPDLVLASDFTAPATLDMLRRLGIRVVIFKATNSLAEVEAQIREMGAVLGRRQAGEAMAAHFAADLAALRREAAQGRHPGAVIYEANGYAPGSATLAGDILAAAGFANRADDAGLAAGGMLALEELVMLAPDAIINPPPPRAMSRGDELVMHPALRRIAAAMPDMPQTGPDWTCATPAVLDAVRGLSAARRAMERGQ